MLRLQRVRIRLTNSQRCRNYSTSVGGPKPVLTLPDSTLPTFRVRAFEPQVPALLPPKSFTSLPALQKWFISPENGSHDVSLNTAYLSRYGATIVPVEITDNGRFTQVHQPLQFFLDASSTPTLPAHVYLAQASLSDLPPDLRQDLPTPALVLEAGRGDIYTTSIWLGRAPTYTPLHRDPNPNLFVQLAGRKRVRLFAPSLGAAVFHHVQARIGGRASATIRGVEMMEGAEREALEEAVWGDAGEEGLAGGWLREGLECEVAAGDGLFIPKGWWHSIKGNGPGMTGSVNWWFR